jgi:RecA/RadA recombinase
MAKVTDKELMELKFKLDNGIKLSKMEKKTLKDNSQEEKDKKKTMSFGQRMQHVCGSEYSQLMGDSEPDKYPIRDWLSTGNYLFNAQIAGSPYKGCPSGRVWQLAGLNSVGKTFLMLETVKNAQALGYFFILFETEMANNSKEDLKSRGINTENMLFVPCPTVAELNTQMINILDEISPNDKVIIGVDSIGNISTTKELGDKTSGNDARDFTKQTELRALFRTVTLKAGIKNVPIIVINHVYSQIMGFGGNIISGGEGSLYNSSIISSFTKAQVKGTGKEDKDDTIAAKITSTNVKCRTAKEKTKIQFNIDFESGLTLYSGLFEWCYEDEGLFIKEKNSYYIDPTKIKTVCDTKEKAISKGKMTPDFWEGFLKNGLAEYMEKRFKYQSATEGIVVEDDEDEIQGETN